MIWLLQNFKKTETDSDENIINNGYNNDVDIKTKNITK